MVRVRYLRQFNKFYDMREGDMRRLIAGICGWMLVAGGTAGMAAETMVGQVRVQSRNLPLPAVGTDYGYVEMRLELENLSMTQRRAVRLLYPRSQYGHSGDYVESIEKTVTLEPGQRKEAVLYLLPLETPGDEEVAIISNDGSEGSLSVGCKHGMNTSNPKKVLVFLASRGFYQEIEDFLDKQQKIREAQEGNSPPGSSLRMEDPTLKAGLRVDEPLMQKGWEVVRSPMELAAWSESWLAYSSYDGIWLTAEELLKAGPGVVEAIIRYVECGGSLAVLGDWAAPRTWTQGPVAMTITNVAEKDITYMTMSSAPFFAMAQGRQDNTYPAEIANPAARDSRGQTIIWRNVEKAFDGKIYLGGFGRCLTGMQFSETMPFEYWMEGWLKGMGRQSRVVWQQLESVNQAHERFAVVENIQTPVRGLALLIVGFAVAIGPLNLLFFAKREKRFRLLWSVPLFSVVMSLIIVVYASLAEGLVYKIRLDGLTILDQIHHRASSVGWLGYYSSLSRHDGMHFDLSCELSPHLRRQQYYYSYRNRDNRIGREVSFTEGQHLGRGWIQARVPSYFIMRRSETRRERLAVNVEGETMTVVNGLGADIRRLVVVDGDGRRYEGGAIAAGAQMQLTRDTSIPDPNQENRHWDNQFYQTTWLNSLKRIHDCQDLDRIGVRPGCYVAEMEGNSFIASGVENAQEDRKGVVYGIFEEQRKF